MTKWNGMARSIKFAQVVFNYLRNIWEVPLNLGFLTFKLENFREFYFFEMFEYLTK